MEDFKIPGPVDPQLAVYAANAGTGRYAAIADLVDFCMWVGGQPCTRGRECDGPDYTCRRHERTAELAARYARMRARRRTTR
jgi:hypothetical protein